jgi:hypothetical protein
MLMPRPHGTGSACPAMLPLRGFCDAFAGDRSAERRAILDGLLSPACTKGTVLGHVRVLHGFLRVGVER